MSASMTARARAREELTAEIKAAAGQQLAIDGASGLSLRAVARQLGMASSAVYRYFPSRDHLLTALIIDGYDALGAAAEAADARCPRSDLFGRWMAAGRAVRAWALAHPSEYALLYGSPVPGYRAPDETIGPASRVTLLLIAILREGTATGVLQGGGPMPAPPDGTHRDLRRISAKLLPDVPDDVILRGLVVWPHVFGVLSFELFGHLNTVVEDCAAFFDHNLRCMAVVLGLVIPAGASG